MFPITTDEDAVDVGVSSSTDGIHWGNPVLVDKSGVDDKNWITCDNSSSSPYYGNCYVEWDLGFSTGQIQMSMSSDGGKTWGAAKGTADQASGIGGQPVVQPSGTVVVPIEAGIGISAFTSTNGGKSWSSLRSVSSIDYWGEQGGLRSGPLPSARVDGAGKVYVVWGDCRFRSGCTANDIVMSTSTNGTKWSAVTRIPIDPTKSTVDHFLPGLGVDRATSGKTAHLAMTYYYYPVSQCDNSCKLEVGFTVSQDGGKHLDRGETSGRTDGLELDCPLGQRTDGRRLPGSGLFERSAIWRFRRGPGSRRKAERSHVHDQRSSRGIARRAAIQFQRREASCFTHVGTQVLR